jgi:hypothetical protein
MVNVVGQTSNLLGAASALSNVAGSIGGLIGGVSLPAPNILSSYASYNYVISLHALTTNDFNFPDTSYKAGKVLPIICKTAGADPNNRIQTGLGKHDFYINNLTFESLIGFQNANATNVSVVQFDVYEPYSIGLFMLALQKAADNANISNWRDATYLLGIEFRGNTEQGLIKSVPFSVRHIPIRLTTVEMKSNENGTRYMINAYAANGLGNATEYSNLRTDTVAAGATIQEVLQTGEQSLQNIVNSKLQEYKESGDLKIADQIVILFPTAELLQSKATGVSAGAQSTKKDKAYVNPQVTAESTAIYKKLGVSPSTLEQAVSSINDIGKASMGFDSKRRGDPPTGNQSDTWDPLTKTWLRGKLVPDQTTGTFKFTQASEITAAITQVILSSGYADKALAPGAADNNGMVEWFRIQTQFYYVDSKENVSSTGKLPKIIVYKIVPFKVHLSKLAGPQIQMPGFDQLKKSAVKRYDYLYTGKNTEVLGFNIDFSVGFANAFSADDSRVDKTGATIGTVDNNRDIKIKAKPTGGPAATQQGQNPGQQNNSNLKASSDGKGGGGVDTPVQRVARTFHDAITNPYDMVNLELEILGDPFWIANSGMGNYTAEQATGVKDLNRDGSVSWQTSEVDVIVNFRSPVDINQVTGLYDFKSGNHQDMSKDPKSGPALGFTGLYCVNIVTNSFSGGSFRQTLKGYRRNGQEYKKVGSGENALNTKTPASNAQGGAK